MKGKGKIVLLHLAARYPFGEFFWHLSIIWWAFDVLA